MDELNQNSIQTEPVKPVNNNSDNTITQSVENIDPNFQEKLDISPVKILPDKKVLVGILILLAVTIVTALVIRSQNLSPK